MNIFQLHSKCGVNTLFLFAWSGKHGHFGKISLIKNSVHWGIDFLKRPLATTVACKLMMTMMKMVKMNIKNTEDDKDEDVKIKVKMSMMMMKKFSHYDGYFVMKVIL